MGVCLGGWVRRISVPMSKLSSVTIHWLLVYFKVLLSPFIKSYFFPEFRVICKTVALKSFSPFRSIMFLSISAC